MFYSFENASFRDRDTGLYSEAYFMEMFYREWHRMIREHAALSVLVVHPNIDIEQPIGFQDYKQLAQLINQNTKRTTDLVSRFHSNEFIIGLFNLSPQGTETIIERIFAAIKQSNAANQLHTNSAFICGLNVHPTRELDINKVLYEVECMINTQTRQKTCDNTYELKLDMVH